MILCARLHQTKQGLISWPRGETRSMSSVPMVFARSVRKIADAAAAHGDVRLLLRTVGLDHEAISDSERRIPYTDMMMLSEHAARMTKDGAFGLHAGERERLETYGIVGHSIL